MLAIHHILLAHRAAYDILKAHNPNAQIGIANNFIIFRPDRAWHLLDQGLFWLIHSFYNVMLLKAFETNRRRFRFPFLIHYDAPIPLDNKIDFWGVNYYYRLHVRFQMRQEIPISPLRVKSVLLRRRFLNHRIDFILCNTPASFNVLP
jgi:beta-glucosidase